MKWQWAQKQHPHIAIGLISIAMYRETLGKETTKEDVQAALGEMDLDTFSCGKHVLDRYEQRNYVKLSSFWPAAYEYLKELQVPALHPLFDEALDTTMTVDEAQKLTAKRKRK